MLSLLRRYEYWIARLILGQVVGREESRVGGETGRV